MRRHPRRSRPRSRTRIEKAKKEKAAKKGKKTKEKEEKAKKGKETKAKQEKAKKALRQACSGRCAHSLTSLKVARMVACATAIIRAFRRELRRLAATTVVRRATQ